jgi:hypothetical protein
VANGADKPVRAAEAPLSPTLRLAPLEADLARSLMEEGVVIRGHDVARVVGLMAGVKVDWEADATR